VATGKKSKRKSAPLLSQGSIKLDKSDLPSGDKASKHNKGLPALPPAARSSRVVDAETQQRAQGDTADQPTKSGEQWHNPPPTASGLLAREATADGGRNNVPEISSPPAPEGHGGTSAPSSLPLSFRIPLPTAGESLMDSIQGAQSDPTPNADKVSIDSTSTVTKQRHSVSSSGYPSTTPSSQPPSSPPKTVVQPADKRKSWNVRSLVASRKSKVEGNERGTPKSSNTVVQKSRPASASPSASAGASARRASSNGVISPHAEVARAAVASVSTKAERRKSTIAEKVIASRSTPNLLATNSAPLPPLGTPSDQMGSSSTQQFARDLESVKKDNMWKRFSLRRTLTDEQDISKADKAAIKNLPTTEDLRLKQLAMRQRAISDAKKPKEEKAGVPVPKEATQPKDDLLEAQLQELQEQQIRERKHKQELVQQKRQQMDEEKRQREIAEAKRQHQIIEERRRQQLAEGVRLQELRLNELQVRRKAEMEKQAAEREANEKADRELAEEQERQKLAKEKELQELHAQLQALQEEERQNKSQPQAARPKMHSRGPSAASMKPWAPPPRVSSSRTSISRTPFTPPQASRKPSLVGQIELNTERASSPR
jgi:hypothetical protein